MIIAWSGLFCAKNLWTRTKCGNATNEIKGSSELLEQALVLKTHETGHLKNRFAFPQVWG